LGLGIAPDEVRQPCHQELSSNSRNKAAEFSER
jgi:hypothetical protein